MWNRALFTWQKNSPASQTVITAQIAPKIYQGLPQTVYSSECSWFHPNRFTFGGVVAQRVNTAKSRPKVIPIFGGTSSRIIIRPHRLHTVHRCSLLLKCRTYIQWSLRLSFYVCLEHTSDLCKNGWTNRDVVWGRTSVSPRNHVLDKDPYPTGEGEL